MRMNLGIAAKPGIAAALFLAPVGQLGCHLIADQEGDVGIARQELAGLHYLAQVRTVQDLVAAGAAMAPLAARIAANEAAGGTDLNTAPAAEALRRALAGHDRAAAVQAAADLAGRAADGSGLTRDQQLDSFYLQDVLTVKVPGAVAGAAQLAAAVAATAGHPLSAAEQVTLGVQTGALQPTLAGIAADADSAIRGNPDHSAAGAIAAPAAGVAAAARTALAALADHARAAEAPKLARPLLAALAAAGGAAAAETDHLLRARIAALHRAEARDLGIAALPFLVALAMIRVAVPRDLRRPWRRLTATLRRRAARGRTAGIDTTAEWPTGSRGPAGHAASARARVPEAA